MGFRRYDTEGEFIDEYRVYGFLRLFDCRCGVWKWRRRNVVRGNSRNPRVDFYRPGDVGSCERGKYFMLAVTMSMSNCRENNQRVLI